MRKATGPVTRVELWHGTSNVVDALFRRFEDRRKVTYAKKRGGPPRVQGRTALQTSRHCRVAHERMPALGWKKVSSHPYYPQTALLPDWQPLVLSYERILGTFFVGVVLIALVGWLLTGRAKHLSLVERLVVIWFLSCSIIHTVIEGNVVLNSKFYTDTSGNILNEIWKEYAKADSRYATRDSFTICMEIVTAFAEGPASLLIVYAMLKQLPWRYTLQIVVSLGQLYGDVLYFATSWFEGLIHCRPEPFYFWFYFVFMNAIWVVIPTAIILRAALHVSAAVSASDRVTRPERKKVQ